MGEAIGQVLSFGVGVTLSPVPIIGVVLMLGTPRARSNGLAFITGWIAGLAVAGTIVLLLCSGAGASSASQPAEWVNVLKLVLGVLLVLVAVRQWRGRPRDGAAAAMPKWMQTIDSFSPAKAAGFGVLLSAVNPKNLLLVVGGAAAIAQTGTSAGKQAVALAVFVVIGTLGTGTPVVLFFVMGEHSTRILDELKGWMAQNNTAIMGVICVLIAAKLIGDAISGFTA
jgi:threonine/homoserine/homoserine lactone efflux protein